MLLYKIAVSLTRRQKRAIILGVDIVLACLSYFLARALLSGPGQVVLAPAADALMLAALSMVTAGTTIALGLHKTKLNAYQMQQAARSASVSAAIAATGLMVSALMPTAGWSGALFAVTGMSFLILTVAARLVMRHALLCIYRRGNLRKPIIIYGAGQTGQQLAMALATDKEVMPVAFVDDDRRLQGLTIAGLRVHDPSRLRQLIQHHEAQRVVLAMPSASRNQRAAISRRIAALGCEVHALPSFADLVANNARSLADTRPVDFDTLLGREQMEEELPGVCDTYRGRRILVTGAGGSIGSELCRQLLTCHPAALILLDHSELALFEIERELRNCASGAEIVPLLGSVCDKGLVEAAMRDHGVEIVLHAAAYKQLPLVERNPLAGVWVNTFGTKIVADAARAAGVERFILISTDKAVRPSSMMGASKRFAELVVQDLAARSVDTRFAMVRFGNVLGSSGSVLPIFHEQIARGGPVTVTHNDVTRYFMTIPEAVRLVLVAGSFARGGDVFVLDMGKPIPIRHLARQMIRAAGLTVKDASNPDGDIEIRITGLRPGEKLHEELLIGSDMLTTPHPRILRAQEGCLSEIEVAQALQALRQALETRSLSLLDEALKKWIEDGATAAITVNE